jgi:hypothetical protein
LLLRLQRLNKQKFQSDKAPSQDGALFFNKKSL